MRFGIFFGIKKLKKSIKFNQEFFKLKNCNENIKKTIAIADEMIGLSETGDADREDVGCGILYGILRDSAYKIKKTAEAEKEAHIKKGSWK
jgi:hypothetical protein